ncbi:MAG: SMC-Scp complex subunit ScpB [Planctomycetota bacterium]
MSSSAEATEAAAPRISDEKLRLLFALLFASPEAVNLERIRQVLYPAQAAAEAAAKEAAAAAKAAAEQDGEEVVEEPAAAAPVEVEVEHFSPRQHLEALEAWMAERNLPLTLHQVGRSYRLLTSEDMADALQAVRKSSQKESLGPAALEVLALVAYRQPVLKADIDAIRGVKSGSHLRHLLDLRLVRILGRAELPGRPFLYGTSREFLDRFGLRDLSDLPEAGRLANPAEQGVAVTPADAPAAAPEEAKSEPASPETAVEASEAPSEPTEAPEEAEAQK